VLKFSCCRTDNDKKKNVEAKKKTKRWKSRI
jgi:hypothetical protein